MGDNAECIPRLRFHSLPNGWPSRVEQRSKCFHPTGIRKTMALFNFFLKRAAEGKWYRRNWWWEKQVESQGCLTFSARYLFPFYFPCVCFNETLLKSADIWQIWHEGQHKKTFYFIKYNIFIKTKKQWCHRMSGPFKMEIYVRIAV